MYTVFVLSLPLVVNKDEYSNKLLRILQHQSFRTPVGNLYKTLNTQPLPLLYEYRIFNFVHTFINNKEKLPVIVRPYFVQTRFIHYYDARRKCDLHLTSMQATVVQKSITSKGCGLWNKLPDDINPCVASGWGVIYPPDSVFSPLHQNCLEFFRTLPSLFLEIYWLQNLKRIFPISVTVPQILEGNEGHPSFQMVKNWF